VPESLDPGQEHLSRIRLPTESVAGDGWDYVRATHRPEIAGHRGYPQHLSPPCLQKPRFSRPVPIPGHAGRVLNLGRERTTAAVHKHGIGVFGAFIIGNDYESPAYYKKLSQFLTHSGIDSVQISILTPLPGTGLMEQMKKEDRLVYQDFPQDWDKYRFSYTVHEPQGVIANTIYAGDNFIKDRLYSFPRYQYRILKSLWNLGNMTSFYAAYKFNKALKKSWKSSHYFNKFPFNFSHMDA